MTRAVAKMRQERGHRAQIVSVLLLTSFPPSLAFQQPFLASFAYSDFLSFEETPGHRSPLLPRGNRQQAHSPLRHYQAPCA